jgi:hypothetical protein
MARETGAAANAALSAIGADARPLFPEAKRRVRLSEIDRLLEGYVDFDNDGLGASCDGEVTCVSIAHAPDCAVAGDPLRTRGSIRAHRIA